MLIKKNFRDLLSDYNSKYGTGVSIRISMAYPKLYIAEPITKDHILLSYVQYTMNGTEYKDRLHVFLKTKVGAYVVGDLSESNFINFLLSSVEKAKLTLEIWPPEKIKYAYLKDNYYAICGQLGSSCMRSKDMQRSLNFYEKQGVQIVVVIDGNKKIHARALLWDRVKVRGAKPKDKIYTYVDRVYACGKEHDMFKKLATENKWLIYGSTSCGNGNSDYYVEDIDVTGITHLPWSDTFRYLYFKDKIITGGHKPAELKFPDVMVECSHTAERGYHRALDPNSVQEVLSGTWVSKKDCTKVKQYGGYVLKANIVEIDKVYYSKFDKKLGESVLDGYIFKENLIHEHITSDTMDKNNGVELSHYPNLVHKKNIKPVNSKLYHKKDPDLVEYKKKWYHASQCVKDKLQQLIPKTVALNVYRLKETADGYITYESDYYYDDYTSFVNLIITEKHSLKDGSSYSYNTTTPLIVDSESRKLTKKHNNKYYLKEQYEVTDKKQMEFSFMKKKKIAVPIKEKV